MYIFEVINSRQEYLNFIKNYYCIIKADVKITFWYAAQNDTTLESVIAIENLKIAFVTIYDLFDIVSTKIRWNIKMMKYRCILYKK